MAESDTGDAAPTPGTALPLGLFEAGDEGFVAALRSVRDAPSLADFAATWYADPRPEARAFLFGYLCEPPNAPGHEGLVKRLFKLAEAAGDDEAMARFLVLTDRLIVRPRGPSFTHRRGTFRTLAEAQARRAEWEAEGFFVMELHPRGSRRIRLRAWREVTARSARGTTLPRPDRRRGEALASLTPEGIAARRWFTVATRRHLQRRAWRYFRRLGRADPARYVRAATTALILVEADEIRDGPGLLDRFGLMHILFGASPALRPRSTGWDLAPGRTLADLAPAPAFAAAWRDHPGAILETFRESESLLIGRWAWRMIEADPERFRALARPDDWRDWLAHEDPEVVRGVVDLLDGYGAATLREVAAREAWDLIPWFARSGSRTLVAEFIGRLVEPGAASRRSAVTLATQRAEELARLGWRWIAGQGVATVPGDADADADALLLLDLLDARCSTLRPTILRGLRMGLARRPGDRAAWLRAFLGHPRADARAEGWAWLRSDDALQADADLWAELAGSPYPDVRAPVAAVEPPEGIDPARLDEARAAVLLAPRGRARAKPAAIRQVVRRLAGLAEGGDDAEVGSLLGILADLTRSTHAPERRSALAALVGLAERFPAWAGRVEGLVPALQLGGGSAIVPG